MKFSPTFMYNVYYFHSKQFEILYSVGLLEGVGLFANVQDPYLKVFSKMSHLTIMNLFLGSETTSNRFLMQNYSKLVKSLKF